MGKTIIKNNSGNDNFDFSNLSLVGKYIETNLGNKGIVVEEWLCYPEPCEWVLDNGYSLNEERMYWENEIIIKVVEIKMTLKDLKQGMVCELRNRESISIIDNDVYVRNFTILVLTRDYNDDFTHKEIEDFDIMKITYGDKVVFERKEAEKRLKQQQATLSVERWIAENDVEVDLNNTNVAKWYFVYDIDREEFKAITSYYRIIMPKQFTLSSEEKVEQLIKEREKELKIMFGVEE